MPRIALIIEYDGTRYYGWQSQPDLNLLTIQDQVTKAISYVANQSISVVCAGRTDAKVHAMYQVVHFDTDAIRSNYSWIAGINSILPEDIRVLHAQIVSEQFDARYLALTRTYNYCIYNSTIKPGLFRNYLSWYSKDLNIVKIQQASQYWLGNNDFASFRGKDCQSKTTIREVHDITCEKNDKFIKITITANSFLKHMVRNMVGVLIKIGAEERCKPIWARQVLLAKHRTAAATTAKPQGLYLAKVTYPKQFAIPELTSKVNQLFYRP